MPPLKRRRMLAALPLVVLGARTASAETKVTFGTAFEGGSFMVYALAFLDAMRTVDPNLEIASVTTKGTEENVPKLEAGELDIAMVSGEIAHELFEGAGRSATKLRVIVAMYSSPGMFAVRSDSRYRSIGELKGKAVVWNGKGSGVAAQARYVLDGLGLDPDKDFQAIYAIMTEGPAMVIDGRATALWGSGLRWPGFIEMANSARGARFIVPSAAEIKTIRDKHAFLRRITVPAGLYRGQYDALETLGTWSYLLARADLGDELGYRLAKDLYRVERAGTLSRVLVESTVKNTLSSLSSPDLLQPGVRRFYREKALLQ
jgi:TRAP transporter TAXI family solute receptor